MTVIPLNNDIQGCLVSVVIVKARKQIYSSQQTTRHDQNINK